MLNQGVYHVTRANRPVVQWSLVIDSVGVPDDQKSRCVGLHRFGGYRCPRSHRSVARAVICLWDERSQTMAAADRTGYGVASALDNGYGYGDSPTSKLGLR